MSSSKSTSEKSFKEKMLESKQDGPIAVFLDKLEVGRKLTAPIYDAHGVLLLAAGCVVSEDQKLHLVKRGVTQVIMSRQDLPSSNRKASGDQPSSAGWPPPPSPPSQEGDSGGAAAEPLEKHQLNSILSEFGDSRPDTETAERLAAVIGEGMQRLSSPGSALKQAIQHHGPLPYRRETARKIARDHQKIQQSVALMLSETLSGDKAVDGNQLHAAANAFLVNLCKDFDASLSFVSQVALDADLIQHALNTAVLGMAIATEMDVEESDVHVVGITGMVQDWGMSLIPREIREARRRLTAEEGKQIRKHPDYTIELLEKIPDLSGLVRTVAYQIHERPDGSGYPRGLRSNKIHLFARILNVADSYMSLISPRPYRAPLMAYSALECLLRKAHTWKVDPEVVRALLRVVSLFPIGSYVMLSDGSVAQVIRSNGKEYSRPVVLLLQDAGGKPVNPGADNYIVDLLISDLTVLKPLPTPSRNEIPYREEILKWHC